MSRKTLAVLLTGIAWQVWGQMPADPVITLPQSVSPALPVAVNRAGPPAPGNSFAPVSHTPANSGKIIRDAQPQQRNRLPENQLAAEIQQDIMPGEVKYEFPDQSHAAGTEFYRQAFEELRQMLRGDMPLNLTRAVFLTENAYLDNRMTYDWFTSDIKGNADIIKTYIAQNGYKSDNPTARKWGLRQFLADTLNLKDENGRIAFTHEPYRYDFEDPWGKQDWSKQFVTKLMSSGEGQCHSLPLFYLIMAEELGIGAWLSYSPSHTYVKIDDGKGNLLNYETTNGYYTTDVWVQSSGYVKAEALRSGIYMDTLSKREVIAACLADLAKGYAIKYGFDDFVLNCLEKSLEYSPNNVHALQLRSDYQTRLFFYVAGQLGRPPVDRLAEFPKAYELFRKMHEIYGRIDSLGFEEMPQDAYERWLKSYEAEKNRQPQEIIRP